MVVAISSMLGSQTGARPLTTGTLGSECVRPMSGRLADAGEAGLGRGTIRRGRVFEDAEPAVIESEHQELARALSLNPSRAGVAREPPRHTYPRTAADDAAVPDALDRCGREVCPVGPRVGISKEIESEAVAYSITLVRTDRGDEGADRIGGVRRGGAATGLRACHDELRRGLPSAIQRPADVQERVAAQDVRLD